jgi:hypothetical protein
MELTVRSAEGEILSQSINGKLAFSTTAASTYQIKPS